jgi:hypothetical protein
VKVDRPGVGAGRVRQAQTRGHPSNSIAQRAAEEAIRDLAATALGVSLVPRRLKLPGGAYVDIDGFHQGPPETLVELYARQGGLRGAQPKKLRADAFKLLAARKLLYPNARLVLVVASEEAERSFYAGWTKEALGALAIELCRVNLDPNLMATLTAAQDRQHMGNTVAGDDDAFG